MGEFIIHEEFSQLSKNTDDCWSFENCFNFNKLAPGLVTFRSDKYNTNNCQRIKIMTKTRRGRITNQQTHSFNIIQLETSSSPTPYNVNVGGVEKISIVIIIKLLSAIALFFSSWSN